MNILRLVSDATTFLLLAGVVEARLRGGRLRDPSCKCYVVTLTAGMYDTLESELQAQHRMISRTAGFEGEHFILDGNIIVKEVE